MTTDDIDLLRRKAAAFDAIEDRLRAIGMVG